MGIEGDVKKLVISLRMSKYKEVMIDRNLKLLFFLFYYLSFFLYPEITSESI